MSDGTPRDLTESERIKMRTARDAAASMLNAPDAESREGAFQQFIQTGDVFAETLNALNIPDDAGEYAAALEAILRRIPDGWGRWISCGPGWYPILCELDSDLAQLDPNYVIHQVKEKFGTLRYYAESDLYRSINNEFCDLIRGAENRTTETCELCGAPGQLCEKAQSRWLKTLCPACTADGYRVRANATRKES